MDTIKAYRVENKSNRKIQKSESGSPIIEVDSYGVDISFETDEHAKYYISSRPMDVRDTLFLRSWEMKKDWFEALMARTKNKTITGHYSSMNKLSKPSKSDGKVSEYAKERALHFNSDWHTMLNDGIAPNSKLEEISYWEFTEKEPFYYIRENGDIYGTIYKVKYNTPMPDGYSLVSEEIVKEIEAGSEDIYVEDFDN